MKRDYVKVPNRLILDATLLPSAKRVAVALLAYKNTKNACCKSIRTICARSGVSRSTVLNALTALEERGFLTKKHRYHYDPLLRRPVFAANRYCLRWDTQKDYTLVPRSLLKAAIPHTAFVVCLYLYHCAGIKGRAYPSLRHTARALDCAKSTVCRSMLVLTALQEIVKRMCKCCTGNYSCNSYYVTSPIAGTGRKHSSSYWLYGTIFPPERQSLPAVPFLTQPVYQ